MMTRGPVSTSKRRGLWLGVTLTLLVWVSLSGCNTTSPWVQVRSQMVGQSAAPVPEVVATPQYQAIVGGLRSVAIKAPDYCANKTAAETEGRARPTGTVLATRCGIEMGEIERALAMVGYQVTSWSTLASTVHNEGLTPEAAAKKLGAQVLFQVNSLQKIRVRPQVNYRWERGVWELDRKGQAPTGKPAKVSDADTGVLFREAGRQEAGAQPQEVSGATLDVNAIQVDTGQTIWFYRGTRFVAVQDQATVQFRAKRGKRGWEFFPAPGQPSPGPKPPPGPPAVLTRSVGGGPASPQDQAYHQVMLELVRDFAHRFSGKHQPPSPPAGAPPMGAPPAGAPPATPPAGGYAPPG